MDSNPQDGETCFFALDSKDNPHISYIGPRAHTNWILYSYPDIRYATSTVANREVEPEELLRQEYSIAITKAIVAAALARDLVI